MSTVTANQVAAFANPVSLRQADAKTIKAFLQQIAETIKDAERVKLKSDFLSQVSVLILNLRTRIFRPDGDYSFEDEMLFGQIKGLLLALEESAVRDRYDRQFFTDTYELGIRLRKLAALVKVMVPIAAALPAFHLN